MVVKGVQRVCRIDQKSEIWGTGNRKQDRVAAPAPLACRGLSRERLPIEGALIGVLLMAMGVGRLEWRLPGLVGWRVGVWSVGSRLAGRSRVG